MLAIGEKQAEYEGYKNEIKAKNNEIEKLRDEISSLEEKRSKILKESYKIIFYRDREDYITEYSYFYLPAEDIVTTENGLNKWRFNFDAFQYYGGFTTKMSVEEIEADLKKRVRRVLEEHKDITEWRDFGSYLMTDFRNNPPAKH